VSTDYFINPDGYYKDLSTGEWKLDDAADAEVAGILAEMREAEDAGLRNVDDFYDDADGM
jgi:hypothetical protein